MERIKQYNARLWMFFGCLFLVSTLLVSVLSLHGSALELPEATTEDNNITVGSKIQFKLNTPSNYKYGKGKADDGKNIGYFDISGEQDVNKKDFSMEFTLSDQAGKLSTYSEEKQAFLDDPVGVKNHIAVYGDATLTEKLALPFTLTAGLQPDNTNAAPWVKLTFPSGSLEGEKDYYVVFDPEMYAIDSSAPLKWYLVYHFKTAAAPTVAYSWQGDPVELLWTEPSQNYLTTETASAQEDPAGFKYYYNECSLSFCPGKKQTFSFDVKGTGANHIGKEGKEPPANHIFIYSDRTLSEDSLVASAADGTITDVIAGTAKSGGNRNVAFAVPENTLKDGQDYYLVIDERLETNASDRIIGAKIITKISAKHDNIKAIPDIRPTCTEPGWFGKTQCETCGSIIDEGKEIPATGHAIVMGNNDMIDPTCTKEGWHPGISCAACGIELEKPHVLPALGHEVVTIEGKAPTCTETGLSEGQVCSRCDEVIKAQETIPASHTEVAIGEAKAATCTEPGMTAGKKCSVCDTVLEEQKEIPALGHTEEVVKGKAATCTEAGLTDGKKCSVCGEILEEQKEIPALGHTEVVVKGKAATCTEKGLTDGKKCSVCDTVLEAQKEIPALGHEYKDGKCTRCGAADPDYKPTPVEPVTKFTGLANEADKDGVWWYYTDGKIDKTHTGVDQNKYGWWRVENGKVNFKAQGIYKNAYGWWKTTDGKVTFKENSIYKNEYGWWKCKDSKVDFNAQSIYQNQYGWWKTTDGKVTFKENGLFSNQYGTWKVENSKVNFNYNGTYQGKTIKNGKVQ